MSAVVLTGVGLAAPGLARAGDLLTGVAGSAEGYDPAALLGARGLRYKDEATRLALLATDRTLRDARLLTGADPSELTVPGDTVGVVVSSNLGNLDTVCRVSELIGRETVTGTSPMDLPNASSNVIASSVAIRHGLRGPNLTVCNGQTSGLDALHWARVMVVGGRAARVLVLGVEVDNPIVRALTGAVSGGLFHGAAGVVVESPSEAARRGARGLARLVGYARRTDAVASVDAVGRGRPIGLWLAPGSGVDLSARHGVDLSARHGAASGALGVMQAAAAVGWYGAGNDGAVLATAGGVGADAAASALLTGVPG